MPMKAFITGGAGFIGSHLTERLLLDGCAATVYDNLSSGHELFLKAALQNPGLSFIRGDLLDCDRLKHSMAKCDIVFHLAANADVRWGTLNPRRDLEQNTIGTSNVLEAMRFTGIRRIVFMSTAAVYGEPAVLPTPENVAFPSQISFYGASKLAGEGLIQAYCQAFGFSGLILRSVGVFGERYTHGHVLDFYRQLLDHPDHLHILGDGKQRKSYVYVQDCVNAILLAVSRLECGLHVLNLGTDEDCTVDESAAWIARNLGLSPKLTYGGGSRGWPGDSPFIRLDCSRLRGLGWRQRLSIRDSLARTLGYLTDNHWVLDRLAGVR